MKEVKIVINKSIFDIVECCQSVIPTVANTVSLSHVLIH